LIIFPRDTIRDIFFHYIKYSLFKYGLYLFTYEVEVGVF